MLIIVEGHLEVPAIKRLLASVDWPTPIPSPTNCQGGANFWKRAKLLNPAAHAVPILGLVDLESHPCPVTLLAENLPHLSSNMKIRIAVPMLEAWLLADQERIATFLGLETHRIPANPEMLQHPKQEIVRLARKSKSRTIRDDLVPDARTGATVGPAYRSSLESFINQEWDPARAESNAPSLARARRALLSWKKELY